MNLITRLESWLLKLDQFLCGLKGHRDSLIIKDTNKLYLKCHACKWESSGILLGK